ncbi:MAG: DGQHR domain-containing protein [Verrucomicrobiaceae bacterium]|nr:DGQHR domain-containing protein [Verrucomicrobiaceae bacterium]
MISNTKSVCLPCLRGNMGDWTYYSTLMSLADVAERIRPAQEIHKSHTLCDMIQRSLSNRLEDISNYILRQPQHLFNSIIVGIYEGDPQWYQLEATGGYAQDGNSIPRVVSESLGALYLTGAEKIFALDGQHRVEGIKHALGKKKSLGSEQLSVIFVAHRNDQKGLQRSRRLFATLNRYAKPVSKLEIIALDEDDPVAITVRSLLRDHPVLSKRNVIATPKGKNMPSGDNEALTTAVTLYEGLLSLVAANMKLDKNSLREFLASRPSEKDLSRFLEESTRVIDLMFSSFPELMNYKKNAGDEGSALPYRSTNGGHLLFRPIGFLAYMSAVSRALSAGVKLELVIRRIAQSNLGEINGFPWRNVIFDGDSGTMKASSGKGAVEAYSTLVLLCSGLEDAVSSGDKKNCKTVISKALASDGGGLSNNYKNLFQQ